MSEIRFRGVGKHYGDVEVITGFDLRIHDGEFMVLVGPSGCAKSTTLRMIAGLERITSGELLIDGKRANELLPAERNISMVFQSYALFPNMSVRENLSFGLRVRKTDSATVASEVDRVTGLLGLGDLLDRKPRQLSGGQAQRVALGRAMIRKPNAFLFDEPLSNLDAELRVQMRGEIIEMQRKLSTTTVYVTHDQVEAMTMGDRIAVMNKGCIMQLGSPTELYRRPANTFVAGFIGSPRMNLLEPGDLLGDCDPTVGIAHDRTGKLGIRPEHLLVESDDGAVPIGDARVTRIEDLGHEVLIHLRNARGTSLTARTGGRIAETVQSGQTVSLALRFDCLHSFETATGERLT